MTGSYVPLLVALSFLVACAASYTALDLAGRVAAARGRPRRWWLLGGALAMGIGIWSMHFIGMLAFRLHGPTHAGPMPMTYDMPLMLGSVLVAVLASALALAVVSRQRAAGLPAWIAAGLAMGGAICGMHYIGMASMRVPAAVAYRIPLVLASLGVAVLASFGALGLAFRLRDERGGVPVHGRLAAALVMGLAIAGMHYTGMAAAVFTPRADAVLPVTEGAVLATDGLAGAIVVGTLVILVLALLGTALDRWLAERLRAAAEHERLYREARAAREEADEAAVRLQEQAVELEQQVEAAQSLALELEVANEGLRERTEALEGALARERLILDSLPDATIAFDHAWRIRYLNPAAAEVVRAAGLDPAALDGRAAVDAFPRLRGTRFLTEAPRAVAEAHPVAFEERIGRDGRWYETRVVPTSDGALTISRDVSDRKRVEEAERMAREAAEAANRAKAEFLATMSHELRTPLNAIGGYVQLMELGLRGPVSDEQRTDLGRMGRAQRHLLGLVNDVLDFARLEAGSVAYGRTAVALVPALEHVHALLSPDLARKALRYEDSAPGCDAVAWADRDRVEQILINLLSNAVKFTPEGGMVRVRCDAEDGVVRVHVTDTGPGIAAEHQQRIFQPFVQLASGLTRPHEGTGLGLAISRDLAHGMGGDLSVASTPGEGSTFTLTLPSASSRPFSPAASPSP